jgi:ATP-dependent DNA helicase RecG
MKVSDTELRKLVGHDESEMLEFKESFDHETIETVGAFANTRGGLILIGVRSKLPLRQLKIGQIRYRKFLNLH